MQRHRTLQIIVHDSRLERDITHGIVPHLNGDSLCVAAAADVLAYVDLVCVCVSPLPADPYNEVIETAQRKRRRCGIIVRTEDRARWDKLTELHKSYPFAFIVAAGGPQEEIRTRFPNVPTISDVQDFLLPGKQIAQFIAHVAQN